MNSLAERLKREAHAVGFALAGIARAGPADGFDRFRAWLDRGYAGRMEYLHRLADARRHPDAVLPEVKSVLMLGYRYGPTTEPPVGSARVARYARGPDYHDVAWDGVNRLAAWLEAEVPGSHARGIADTAPLLERDFARRAGLGWIGRNTMLIDRRLGSYFFLAALLTDVDLPADAPHEASHCGSCTACLDACPTDAFVGSGWLDARRCLSYLTVELHEDVPDDLRPAMKEWLFGCDVCQEVCPWNHGATPVVDPALAPLPDLIALDPVELLGLSDAEFRRRFRGTALYRARRRGLVRTAALIVGNRGDRAALPALRALFDDEEPVVREAARWAAARIEER